MFLYEIKMAEFRDTHNNNQAAFSFCRSSEVSGARLPNGLENLHRALEGLFTCHAKTLEPISGLVLKRIAA
jgi:hypothetical protein